MNNVSIVINQYPNHNVYIISCKDETVLNDERLYFLNIFGSDNVGNDSVIISPIVKNNDTYSFMVTSRVKGIMNEYRKRIGNYTRNGYIDMITR